MVFAESAVWIIDVDAGNMEVTGLILSNGKVKGKGHPITC
jgi:hypothetical protein